MRNSAGSRGQSGDEAAAAGADGPGSGRRHRKTITEGGPPPKLSPGGGASPLNGPTLKVKEVEELWKIQAVVGLPESCTPSPVFVVAFAFAFVLFLTFAFVLSFVLCAWAPCADGENVFQIKSFKYTYLMAARTPKEKEEWMQVIHSTRERLYRGTPTTQPAPPQQLATTPHPVFVFSFFRLVICDASSQLPLNVHTTHPTFLSPRQLALGFEPAKGQHTRNKDHNF
jgi:hypothetical protein